MEKRELPEALNIDGIEYKVDELDPTVKRLLTIYQMWEKDANDARLSVAKSEAALRDLTREIQTAVVKNAAERKEASETPPSV